MASAQKKTTLCCQRSSPSPDLADKASSASLRREAVSAVVPMSEDWNINGDLGEDRPEKSVGTRIPRPDFDSVDVMTEAAKVAPAQKGTGVRMMRAETKHPLDPLSPAEIAVTIATVRAAGATPEVRDGMRFIEVVLKEPEKHVVALADAYFFPPFQPSLLTKTKGGPVIPRQLPPSSWWPS